ncbi:MAG TPA: hypothetical protein VM364_00570 [Vicinamibacterales bacterium]|nr:hypothetical protein [Vicinamibacterales bacterium]
MPRITLEVDLTDEQLAGLAHAIQRSGADPAPSPSAYLHARVQDLVTSYAQARTAEIARQSIEPMIPAFIAAPPGLKAQVLPLLEEARQLLGVPTT